MPAAVNAGDWLAEIDQVSRSHAVSTLVHLNAQPEPNPVSDIQPVQNMATDHDLTATVLSYCDLPRFGPKTGAVRSQPR